MNIKLNKSDKLSAQCPSFPRQYESCTIFSIGINNKGVNELNFLNLQSRAEITEFIYFRVEFVELRIEVIENRVDFAELFRVSLL